MLTVPAPTAVTANCDSNCADPCSPGCVLVLPVANCGDNDCSSCVCIVPVSDTSALVIFATEGAMLMLAVESGRFVGGCFVTA